jgi:glycosyltransferase involved in cell wall biosynthesis
VRPTVSVIIPARDAAATIGFQLEALSRQDYCDWWEVVVVTHDSHDDSDTVASRWRDRLPHLRVVNVSGPGGAGFARNEGCHLSKGDLFLFCDADDVVHPGWLAAMVEGLERYDAAGGPLERLLLNDPRSLAWRPHRPPGALPDHFRFLPYAHGANFGVRRTVWEQLGGFNGSYRASEDVEFSWRVQLSGYGVGFLPDAAVSYRYRSSLPSLVRQNYAYGKSHARLYKAFFRYGMPRRCVQAVAKDWWWLASHMFDGWRSHEMRGAWLGRFARCAGHVVGSLRNRVLYL